MTRIRSKEQLLGEVATEYDRLVALVDSVDDDAKVSLPVCGGWTVKDLLAHLHAWHLLYLGWYDEGCRGGAVHLPADGYKWNETPRLNDELYRRYRGCGLADVRSRFEGSHLRLVRHIESLSEQQLLRPGVYPWTGKNPLATYVAPNSCNHYRWAGREIRRGARSRRLATSR